DIGLRDLGEHRLQDLAQPQRVFQFTHPALPDTFPALRGVDSYPHNLPIQPTPLIGREQELASVERTLMDPGVRLLTLTGAGGAGKTRIALQAAADLLENFPAGSFFVPLAAI